MPIAWGWMYIRKPHFIRSFLAAALVLAAIVVTPGVSGAANESASLDATRRELAETRRRLDQARGQAAVIQSEVGRLDKQIAELNRQIRTQEHDISTLESGIRTAEAKIVELEARFAKAAEASRQRARQIYIAGPAETFLSTMFSAKSITELLRLQVFWEVSSEIDGKTMLDATRIRADLVERKEDLSRIKSDLNLQRRWMQERRSLVASARATRNAALTGVQAQIADHESHVRELEAESKRLTAVLRGSLSRSSGAVSRSGFIWPINGRVTSGYGRRWGGFHSGIDIDGNTGDPIRASKAGSIAGVTCGSGYGICTVIDHGGGVATLYSHQSRKAVSSGSVSQGQVIGYVGCTGSCTGSHLHFEVRVNGDPQNPMNFLP